MSAASPGSDPSSPEIRERAPKGQGMRGRRVHSCVHMENGQSCGKVYSRAEHLRRHQLSHTGQAFRCSMPGCKAIFVRADLAWRHIRLHHPDAELISDHDPTSPIAIHGEDPPISDSTTLQHPSVTNSPLSPSAPVPLVLGETDSFELSVMQHLIHEVESIFLPSDACATLQGPRDWWLLYARQLNILEDSPRDLLLSWACAHISFLQYDSDMERRSSAYHRRGTWTLQQLLPEVGAIMSPATLGECELLLFASMVSVCRYHVTLREQVRQKAANRDIYTTRLAIISMAQNFAFMWQSMINAGLAEKTNYWACMRRHPRSKGTHLRFFHQGDWTYPVHYFSYLLDGLDDDKDPRLSPTSANAAKQSYRTMLQLIEEIYTWLLDDVHNPKPPDQQPICPSTPGGMSGVLVPKLFLQRCTSLDPRAMAILAHYILLDSVAEIRASGMRDLWWSARSTVPDVVLAIAAMIPPTWAWTLEWPLGVVRGELDIADVDGLLTVPSRQKRILRLDTERKPLSPTASSIGSPISYLDSAVSMKRHSPPVSAP